MWVLSLRFYPLERLAIGAAQQVGFMVEGGDQIVDPLVLIRPTSITFWTGCARPASNKENSQEGTTKERGYAVTQAAPLTRVRGAAGSIGGGFSNPDHQEGSHRGIPLPVLTDL